jgi:geranylgeranyl diphosphate synthase type II
MYSLKELQDLIHTRIEKLQPGDRPARLYEPIQYVLSLGGKRIRPALCLLSFQLFNSNEPDDSIIYPALGLEVFHNFTLLHDDVMDGADMRRGMPTVHKKWDTNTAILSGDAMMIKAYQYMAMCPVKYMPEVINEFNDIALGVCEGQQYDMDFETRNDVTVDEYLEMIRLKTSVLIAGSLKIGAIIGGASEKDKELLYDFGENIGIAFQLQDDYLDTYGDPAVFGKNIGGDIVNNKKTFLLLQAMQKARGHVKKELEMWLGTTESDDGQKIEAVRNIYDELGVPALSQALMNDYFDRSMDALEGINADDDLKQYLKQFAVNLVDRVK